MGNGLKFLKSFLIRYLIPGCSRSSGWPENRSTPSPYFSPPRYDGAVAPGSFVHSLRFWRSTFLRFTALLVILTVSLAVPVFGAGGVARALFVPGEISVSKTTVDEGDPIRYTVTVTRNDKIPQFVKVQIQPIDGPGRPFRHGTLTTSAGFPPGSTTATGKVETMFDGKDGDASVRLATLRYIPDQNVYVRHRSVIVTVKDGNDSSAPPVFTEGSSTRRSFVPGGAPADVGAPVVAMDADNDPLTYSLEGADASSFNIDSGTGQIKTMAQNYQAGKTYLVTVKADDGKGGTATILVSVSAAVSAAVSASTPQEGPPSSEVCAVSGVTDDQSLETFVECAARRIEDSDTFTETLRLLEEFRDGEGNWNDGSTYLVLLTARGGVYFHANNREVEDLDWSGILSCEGGGSVLDTEEGCFIEYEEERRGYAHPLSASHVPLARDEAEFVLLGGFNKIPEEGKPFTGMIGEPLTEAGVVDTDDELKEFVEEAGRVLGEAVSDPGIDPAELRGILRREGPWKEGDVHVYIMSEMGRVIFDGADRDREQKDESAKQYVKNLISGADTNVVEYMEDDFLMKGYTARVEVPLDAEEDSRVYIVGSGYRVEGGSGRGGGCAVGGSGSGGVFGLFVAALALFLAVSLKRGTGWKRRRIEVRRKSYHKRES